MNLKELYEHSIEFEERNVKFYESQLQFTKIQLKRERESDKELVEYIWGKGVVTKMEKEIFHAGYKSEEVKKLEKEAKKERKAIRECKKQIAGYKAKLAELK